ncbi:MAG: resolvase domain-containing protein [Stygiobacter sp.]|nr:MAG: resolvase domain-containing protein [Stygiobacter sp.]KAF0218015.1 MAG: resolvase domain-containing [Ignavibacteria bacterium]
MGSQKTAVIYTRVSTEEQAESGYSLRDQESRLRSFCERENIQVLEHFQDSHSGKTFNRPGFNSLITYCKKNNGKVDFLYTTKVDRLGRNVLEALSTVQKLKEQGIQFQSIEQPMDYSSPEAFLMQVLYHTLPDVENQRRAKNIKSGMRRAQKEGRFFARITPLGYVKERDHKGKPIYVPGDKADTIRRIFNEVATNEVVNINAIRKSIGTKGIFIIRSNIYKILRNPFYMGKIFVKADGDEPEELVEGLHEGLITQELFYKVQEVLDGKNRNYSKSVDITEEQIQKGFLLCKRCGRVLMASTSSGNGGKYNYYHCISSCGERVRAEKVNLALLGELQKINIRPEVLELFQMILEENLCKNAGERKIKISAIEKSIAEVENQLLQIDKEHYLSKTIPVDSYNRLKESLNKNLNTLSAKKFDLDSGNLLKEFPNLDHNILSNLPFFFKKADVGTKREIIGSIFPEKLVFDSDSYRTIKRNSVLELLVNDSKGFSMAEIKKSPQKGDLSTKVLPGGFEPPT